MAKIRLKHGSYYSVFRYKDETDSSKEKWFMLNTSNKERAQSQNKMITKQEKLFKSGVITLDEIQVKEASDLDRIIDMFIDQWKLDGKSEKTTDVYERALAIFKEAFDDYDLGLLNKRDYPLLLHVIAGKYDNVNSKNITLRSIRTFLNWCVDTDVISKMPFKIKQYSKEKKRPRYFTDNEVSKVLKSITKNKKLHARILIHWITGMRRSEIHSSYYENGYIEVYNPIKQGCERTIPIDPKYRKYYSLAKRSKYTDSTVSKKFKKILEDLGIDKTRSGDKRHFHHLRDTFAVRNYCESRDIYKVSKLLGHSDVKTTEIYTKFNIDKLELDFKLEWDGLRDLNLIDKGGQKGEIGGDKKGDKQ